MLASQSHRGSTQTLDAETGHHTMKDKVRDRTKVVLPGHRGISRLVKYPRDWMDIAYLGTIACH
jgi:hypothetical protein